MARAGGIYLARGRLEPGPGALSSYGLNREKNPPFLGKIIRSPGVIARA